MLFNSAHFVLFFSIVYPLFLLLGLYVSKLQWPFILIASAVFYMAAVPQYIFILLAMILIDYFAGLLIVGTRGGLRRLALLLSILSNCAILFFFKYFTFFMTEVLLPLGVVQISSTLGWALPIGLSFHTFQSLSYVIEVYRGHAAVERRLDRYALYVLFFPQLVAGPIERPQNLLHQFARAVTFDASLFRTGAQLVLWGTFKKVVIADRLAYMVDSVYRNYESVGALSLLIATVAFAFQIYCDFSGYSDIAIGVARMLGIDLMINFDRPYLSRSVREFWRRWHISLSTWFRDYVYHPLGGSRTGFGRHLCNLIVTFCLSGLWHGANWTYVAWGALNGLFLVFEQLGVRMVERSRVLYDVQQRVPRVFFHVFTFTAVCLTWVFFRSESMAQAGHILKKMAVGPWYFELNELLAPLFGKGDFVFGAVVIPLLLRFESWCGSNRDVSVAISSMTLARRWLLYVGLTILILLFGIFDSKSFIYFQF